MIPKIDLWPYIHLHICGCTPALTQVAIGTHVLKYTCTHMHEQKVTTTTTKQPNLSLLLQQNLFLICHQCPNYKRCPLCIRSVDATSFCALSALCTHAQLLSCACWLGLLDWQLTPQLLAPLVCLVVLHVQTFPLLRNVGTGSHTLGITWLENRQQNLPIKLFIWSIRVMLVSAWGSFSWVLTLNLLYDNDQWLLGKYQNLSVPTYEMVSKCRLHVPEVPAVWGTFSVY